jgi:CRISPR-associated endonuclease Csn1
MSKKILGLDLGTNSIGWALVNEAENKNEQSDIIKLGARVIQYDNFSKVDKSGKVSESKDPTNDFLGGKSLSPNASRTLKRGARRNLQRFKLRRKELIKILIKNKFVEEDTPLTEIGKNTTHETLSLRAKAAKERINLEDFAKVLLMINKKRGYKSSRKVNNDDEGTLIDGMGVAKYLYDHQMTPGQYVYKLLKENKKYIPDFYRSDLKSEFNKVWSCQKQFYPDILDEELYKSLENQGQQNSRKRFLGIKGIYTAENKGKRDEVKLQYYKWRSEAIEKKLTIEEVAYVLVEINNNLNQSSGYLGAISDRSKRLYFDNLTVGEYIYNQVNENPHTSLKNQVFYRQDYLDEFERIWEVQAKYYPNILTNELKEQIRDVIIFYQRKLKSQKGLISFCHFESKEEEYFDETTQKTKKRFIGHRVVPKSSPLFQEFKIWQIINNLTFRNIENKEDTFVLEDEHRNLLFEELNLRGNLSEKDVFKILKLKPKHWKSNFPNGLEGNRTNAALYNIYQKIAENEGYGFDWAKKNATEIKEELKTIFPIIGINENILDFDCNIESNNFDKQDSFQLWHLLYSAEDDNIISDEDKVFYGNNAVSLKKNLHIIYVYKPEYAKLLANIALQDDYGNLSTKAIRKIIPYLQDGNEYSEACTLAGYNHSNSLKKEENEKRTLKPYLDILQKNSLRNPVVEKILNQMVNLINQIIDEYGKPDEVRIELARELKKSATERADATKFINDATSKNDEIRKIIKKDFGFTATKSDVIRYKLWEELKNNGYKTLFTDKYIPREKLFSKDIDIEHIIPKAMLYDDSFSNKTLAYRTVNLKKRDRTAIDFIAEDYIGDLQNYNNRVESLYKAQSISKGKYKKLLMSADKLPSDFIERDLRNSQYIAKKARAMLLEVFKTVVPTSGSITDKLRKDWNLINVMKELNLSKYRELGLTEMQVRWDSGQEKQKQFEVIKDWTKRNDHRHHAMDALTVAFTTHSHIQYINNLNASRDKSNSTLYGIRETITFKDKDDKRKFIAPMGNFRSEAKNHIESILISFKTKNKVVTQNINKTKVKGKENKKVQITPRGQLHKETVYGKIKLPAEKPTVLNANFTLEQANSIVDIIQRKLILEHLFKFENNSSVAFAAKTLKNDTLLYKGEPIKKVICFEDVYTIRKDITPDNFKNEKLFDKIVGENVKQVLLDRFKEFGNDSKKAFSDLEKNPIWLNKEKGISIKRVTITGVSNTEALHWKKNHLGNEILDKNGNKQAVDFVSTRNNHHVAIYKDEKGNLQEKVVSFYEAVARVNTGETIIDYLYNESLGWTFLFTMKQNEMFVFPSDDFDPNEIDLMDERNYTEVSKHLFRVQSLSIVKYGNNVVRDFYFRHHLETQSSEIKALKDIAYCHVKSLSDKKLLKAVKVRINHLGKIVIVGEENHPKIM